AWPYRDYVIRAFNQDVPYARFIREQLAGDVGEGNDFLTQSATGFLVAGAHDLVGNETMEGKLQQRADDLFDIVSTTGSTFLCLTVGCARCHDHKFDPISQRDYYSIQAVFAGIEHKDRDIQRQANPDQKRELANLQQRLQALNQALDLLDPAPINGKRPGVHPRRNVERFAPTRARYVRFSVLETIDGSEPCIDEIEITGPGETGNLALASRGVKLSASSVYPNSDLHKLEHVNDGLVGNSRSWISAEPGKGWVQLDLERPQMLDRIVWGRDREERFRDRLARKYRIEGSLNGKTWQLLASGDDRLAPGSASPSDPASAKLQEERKQVQERITRLNEAIRIYAGVFRQPDPTFLLRRGDVMQKTERTGPGSIAAIAPALNITSEASDPERRLALADWLAHSDNPLPARVLVNRLWYWHFGTGLVSTPGDFGYGGSRPSHPELLDWLASEFLSGGGTMKRLQRMMVLSRAYRQASVVREDAMKIDAGNRLLWRMSPRRLEAEALRDGMLQASGTLDTRMGGEGYHLWDYSGYVIVYTPKKKLGPAEFRRMVYQFKPRLQQDGTFGAFDCPDATTTVARRNVSTTALQALNLLHDPFVLDQSERFAERLTREIGSGDVSGQVQRAFLLAFGRPPEADEHASGIELVRQHGLASLCRALYNANEFVFIR
ncbi:MAG: DUF1553 domain-containing protein, partial [Gemmataceae bacterium]